MSKTRSRSFNTTVNIISGVGVMLVNICISFFLSPYIIRTIGVEANGFVNLANNFIAYADLIVTALNAMAARFITIAYVNEDYKKANLYYNSVFWGNLMICGVLLIPAVYVIGSLEKLVDVPVSLITDVKILFAIAFFGFFARTAAPNWDCGPYVKNRMDRSSLATIASTVVKVTLLVGLFSVLYPHVWFVGIATTASGIIYLFAQGYNTHTLTPELRVRLRKPVCSFKAIAELVGSGIWSSIAIAGNTLMSGLDLLVCNMYLGATLMGVLSVSKSIPNILTTFSETIRGAFGPELTISYAEGNKEAILDCIVRSVKISSVIVTIPTAGIIVMSDALYRLWIPSQDAKLLQVLTALAVLRYIFCSGVANLNNVFTTVNKIRYNTIALVITGFLSIATTILLVIFTDLDLYAVAGVSSVVMVMKDLVFMLPVTARLLGYKWYQFYPYVGQSVICTGLITVIGFGVKMVVPCHNWALFFLSCMLIGALGLALNMRIMLNASERRYLIRMVKRRLHLGN